MEKTETTIKIEQILDDELAKPSHKEFEYYFDEEVDATGNPSEILEQIEMVAKIAEAAWDEYRGHLNHPDSF
jgi:hypothetical protein